MSIDRDRNVGYFTSRKIFIVFAYTECTLPVVISYECKVLLPSESQVFMNPEILDLNTNIVQRVGSGVDL